jgi:non-lysosomal glucosylceramidase
VEEGLAVMKTLDERYDGNKRNPFNEVECGDHYARSMASYGALIAISGFEYDGPERRIGFAPRLTPENFKAPFTAAEGWGSYSQKIADGTMRADLAVKYGKVPLRTMSLVVPEGKAPATVSATLGGKALSTSVRENDGALEVAFDPEVTVEAGQTLEVEFSAGS